MIFQSALLSKPSGSLTLIDVADPFQTRLLPPYSPCFPKLVLSVPAARSYPDAETITVDFWSTLPPL